MSSQILLSLAFLPNLLTQLSIRSLTESDKPKSPCMAPRATSFKEQGFSEAVAQELRQSEPVLFYKLVPH